MIADLQVQSLAWAVDTYRANRGKLPETLQALLEKDPGSGEPYAERIGVDPWRSNPYVYKVLDAAKGTYEVRSYGPDRAPNTLDDTVKLIRHHRGTNIMFRKFAAYKRSGRG